MFTGDLGDYFMEIFLLKRDETNSSDRVVASKKVGWEKK